MLLWSILKEEFPKILILSAIIAPLLVLGQYVLVRMIEKKMAEKEGEGKGENHEEEEEDNPREE